MLFEQIHSFAKNTPNKIAIQGENQDFSYQDLWIEIEKTTLLLACSEKNPATFAFLLENHPAWAILDLALWSTKQNIVPLPAFFSIAQLEHALIDAEVDFLIIDQDYPYSELIETIAPLIQSQKTIQIANKKCHFFIFKYKTKSNLKAVKITYTSGTTGQPKGVVLAQKTLEYKIKALAQASEAVATDKTLSILPLATLLENIGGLYVPLYCGATAILWSAKKIGLTGSSQIDPLILFKALTQAQPTCTIIIPQILFLFLQALSQGLKLPTSLRFIALGGAPISHHLLTQAEQLHIPIFEGYGLSEAASVVALNTPTESRLGSVGKVLPLHQLKIDETGEIWIKDYLFEGYIKKPSIIGGFYPTGDLGHLDQAGFLYLTGRKKNTLHTSYGRNISPEWIEKELEAIPFIAQAVIFGHAKPHLIALIVPRMADLSPDTLTSTLAQLNQSLPDYAHIQDYLLLTVPFSIENGQLTGTGRPKRSTIYQQYQTQINALYHEN